jgi:hypothetical protein
MLAIFFEAKRLHSLVAYDKIIILNMALMNSLGLIPNKMSSYKTFNDRIFI